MNDFSHVKFWQGYVRFSKPAVLNLTRSEYDSLLNELSANKLVQDSDLKEVKNLKFMGVPILVIK